MSSKVYTAPLFADHGEHGSGSDDNGSKRLVDQLRHPPVLDNPPEPPVIVDDPPPETDEVGREELEMAFQRARLVADDCATILQPAIRAMQDGAWVSRTADEFSLALEDNNRIATESGERTVEIIEQALGENGDDTEVTDPEDPTFRAQPEPVEL